MNILDIDEKFQSGFKNKHSTETALLYVTNQLRISADNGNVSILITLDLSSAFDTLDHTTLLDILNSFLGISDLALDWFRSYLSNRSQKVLFNNSYSESKILTHGVPQGSVDGPPLFRIYILPLLSLFKKLKLSFHVYADDTQIYLCCSPSHFINNLEHLQSCYTKISDLLSKLFLKLNDSKTEIILIGSKSIVESCKSQASFLHLNESIITFSSYIKNLGVTFDENLTFKNHIKNVSKNAMFRLRNLLHVRPHFDITSFKIIIHATVTSLLDYCNSLLSGLPASSLRDLQLVQNFAARLVLKRSKFCHVTPLLYELHWLPIESRIKFKVLLFVYKSVNDLAPPYLIDLIQRYEPSRPLRSSESCNLITPRFNKNYFGGCSFAVFGPKVWNSLPYEIKTSSSINVFKKSLKTHLFSQHFDSLIF